MGEGSPPLVIEAVGVTKHYGDREVLRGLDLSVRAGEILCLLGPNGAGKTTTVEILEGYRKATAGQVRVLGFDPTKHPRELRERTGVVLQECGFPAHLRVKEIVNAWRRYYARPRPYDELLEVVGLAAEANMLVRHLSGGQRRRLDFALALAGDPDLIYLDEPTTGFDPEARMRCWTAIDNLRTLGKTILLTTHYLDEAERLADRVAVLGGGLIRAVGSPRELADAAGITTVISFAAADGQVIVPTANPSDCLRTLLTRFGTLPGLTVSQPRLEDAYLQLVGSQNLP